MVRDTRPIKQGLPADSPGAILIHTEVKTGDLESNLLGMPGGLSQLSVQFFHSGHETEPHIQLCAGCGTWLRFSHSS